MAVKHAELPGIGKVTLYKRRGNRKISLSLSHDGQIRISLPMWVPYRAGLEFAKSRAAWLTSRQAKLQNVSVNGQAIGKAHHLSLQADSSTTKITTRLLDSDVMVRFPSKLQPDDPAVQKAVRTASLRALRKEAEQLLPQRVAMLARQHDFTYKDVHLRHLKSRWGSCNSVGSITLNIYLMQLPWHLIDYVLLHELVHTKVLRHGPDFWRLFEQYLPDAKKMRKDIQLHLPTF
ncbi:MAG TPA: SprT family zinc-dependent metalloprotease [Candidatus Saccharimonadales bacterium]|nr:SprT family zinc-dependent metalloprotease [Candidatus Saccharimonadales bacterium]